jgi:nucleoside-diphosphate-sugar epimerase
MTQLVFGLGYTSSAFVTRIGERLGTIIGTRRQASHGAVVFDGQSASADIRAAAQRATTVLVSTPPDEGGDPVLAWLGDELSGSKALRHVLYLSTIGVYGDQAGAWIDGGAALRTTSDRGQWRVRAEQQWLDFGARTGANVQIFRLGGIYGPGRNPLVDLAKGTSRRIEKTGQVFNRIHVSDIARVLEAALDRGAPGSIWNVVDDEPAPPQDVIAYAARLCGAPVPPLLPFETTQMSPMARSFYSDNRRVSNRALKRTLGVSLQFPTYRDGIEALFQAGEYHPESTSLRPRDRKARQE